MLLERAIDALRVSRARYTWAIVATGLLLTGCGARTSPPQGRECWSVSPVCVAPPEDGVMGGCAAPRLVDPQCVAPDWQCPAGSRPYARKDVAGTCKPFDGAGGMWGLGSFARVPIEDGRCLWIADSASTTRGTERNVAFEPDLSAPFGSCPATSKMAPASVVSFEPGWLVQIDGGYRLNGQTRVVYRLFKVDATAVFGATEIGGGLGQWDPAAQRIVIPSPALPRPWRLDLDLGDAVLSDPSDGKHAYVLGCSGRFAEFEQSCRLARVDTSGSLESFGGAWMPTNDASKATVLFGAGTWSSSIVAPRTEGGAWTHVYIADFGSHLATHVASTLTGPWSDSRDLQACELAAGDPKSFCAGPIVHEELADPTRPGELPITYGVGTTGQATGDLAQYATRLVWAR